MWWDKFQVHSNPENVDSSLGWEFTKEPPNQSMRLESSGRAAAAVALGQRAGGREASGLRLEPPGPEPKGPSALLGRSSHSVHHDPPSAPDCPAFEEAAGRAPPFTALANFPEPPRPRATLSHHLGPPGLTRPYSWLFPQKPESG